MSLETCDSVAILIVDDTPSNLHLLFTCLEEASFKVLVAQNGESALEKATYGLPDLILLDVLMPGMDGFEVCRRLKAQPETQNIPIIFMTALSETVNKIKGFDLGAIDYITKPIEQQEVLARIKTHLTLSILRKRLQKRNDRLQEEIERRQEAETRLERARDELEVRVRERTATLADTNERLLREIDDRTRIEQALFEEKELAQVTLESIGDAVITTDANGNVGHLNPIAEKLTGWRIGEVKGRPIAEIFKIVCELTRRPLDNPAIEILRDDRISALNHRTILIARDGSEYAIDDSAAPIRARDGRTIGAVLVFRDVTQSRQLANQLSWQATHDDLTGLLNRRAFEQRLTEAIVNCRERRQHYVLCYLDLDQFKVVNDTCGHIAGDELLRQVTTLLQKRVRATDILARLGGDEFGLLLARCSLVEAEKLAETLRKLIQEFRFAWQENTFALATSIGLVEIDDNTRDLTDILSAADAACYAAKARGRNCVHTYRQNDRELARQRGERQWIVRINQALEENRFCLYAQRIAPVVPQSGKDHYEVLLRLRDKKDRLVPPMAFIPAAERYDLMPAIDRWVISTFFSSYQLFLQTHPRKNEVTYTINLSGASVGHPDFLAFLKAQFANYPISPDNICFEITETTAIANLSQAVALIDDLKRLGCRFALDDFGSGMSSLTYLKNLPVDYLKIDGSFVKNITRSRIDAAMVDSFNRIAHEMGIKTIAEFVENNAILDKIKEIGLDYAQGNGIAEPRPLAFGKIHNPGQVWMK
ncbi:MAG: EAL domain-containing protein [Cyanobacteriota bacterium]|nr:EAL domain-containing protein [Cyanobacteriota bacterium]